MKWQIERTGAGPLFSRAGLRTFERAFWVAAVPGAILFAVMQTYVHVRGNMFGADSHAYWMAARFPDTWYSQPPAYRDAYLYSPAFAQLLWPLGQLPWRAFQILWMGAQVGVLAWLLRPLGVKRALVLAPFFVTELLLGNVYFFFAGALVLLLRKAPGAIALPLLTKVAPAVVAVWFVARRDWRPLLRASILAGVVVAVSVLLDRQAWIDWFAFLVHSAGERGAFASLRAVAALLLTIWAARRGRSWLLAPTMILACPVLGGYGPLAVLAAVPRLLVFDRWLEGESAHQATRTPTSEQARATAPIGGD